MDIFLTPLAEKDLQNIREYSRKEWGEEQANRYLDTLENRFEKLAKSPQTGRERKSLEKGCRSVVEGSHIIVYREHGKEAIEIISVIHSSRDIDRILRRKRSRRRNDKSHDRER